MSMSTDIAWFPNYGHIVAGIFVLTGASVFDLIEHFIQNFPRLNRKQKMVIIIKGIYSDDENLLSTNIQ